MDPLPISKCNASGKTRYQTPGDARQAILRIKYKKNAYESTTLKRIKRRSGKPDQCRHYYCKLCKGYHLTSSSTAISQLTIEKQHLQRIRSTEGLVLTKEQAAAWKANGLPFPNEKTNDQ
jgi:hypothetical protein